MEELKENSLGVRVYDKDLTLRITIPVAYEGMTIL
jgi:hypothetical protein